MTRIARRDVFKPLVLLRYIVMGFILLTGFLSLILASRVANQIARPLAKVLDMAQRLFHGDLTAQIKVENKDDETGVLANTMNQMSTRLQNTVMQIDDAATQVSTASQDLAQTAHKLAGGAQEQAATFEETSAAVEELTASVEQVASNASSQATTSREAMQNIYEIERAIEQITSMLSLVAKSTDAAIDKAQEGSDSVNSAIRTIKGIAESSSRIVDIVNVISDIADQTNLLALNASIEAARAGEYGQGFAVVASEIGKLADRSASSTREIETLVSERTRQIQDGVRVSEKSGHSMRAIIDGSEKSSMLVKDLSVVIMNQMNEIKAMAASTMNINEMSQNISMNTDEQANNAGQVTKAIEDSNTITQRTVDFSQEMSISSEKLRNMALQLQELMSHFTIKNEKKIAETPKQASKD